MFCRYSERYRHLANKNEKVYIIQKSDLALNLAKDNDEK